MAKVSSFRLSDEALARLARLQAAARHGESQAEIISDALYMYEQAQAPLAQRLLLDLYTHVGRAADPLQALEDERPLLPEEQEVLDLINKVWDMCRACKLFIEPELPLDPWEREAPPL